MATDKKMKALIELRALRLLNFQRQLRAEVLITITINLKKNYKNHWLFLI